MKLICLKSCLSCIVDVMNDHYRYPRTPHLPWSESVTKDDKYISAKDLAHLQSLPDLLLTEKMDGGNLTFYRDYFHGRSLDSGTNAWDTAAKALWASIRFKIPEGWRISGESVYARRSVAYENLPGVYLIFGGWDEENNALDWDTVVELAKEISIPTVPVLYRGSSFEIAKKVWATLKNADTSEGYVLRNAGSFPYSEFSKNVAKYVRENHIRTSDDWRHRDDFTLNGVAL